MSYRVESAIESQGLDVCCGNLHAVNYGKSALVFDLMEEFRSPVCDCVFCSLFNLGTLAEDDFEQKDFSSASDDFPLDEVSDDENDSASKKNILDSVEKQVGVLLTKVGLKKVITAFEAKMNSMILYQPASQKLSYEKIIY